MRAGQKNSHEKLHEAVGLFDTMDGLQQAVNDLEGRSFPHESISVMGGRDDVEKAFGAPAVPPARAERDPAAPRQTPVRLEEEGIGKGVLVGGGLYLGAVAAAMLAAASGGAVTAGGIAPIVPAVLLGGAVGAIGGGILMFFLRQRIRRGVEEQIRKGGLLLWVRTPDRRRERVACAVLKARGAKHVHVQKVPG